MTTAGVGLLLDIIGVVLLALSAMTPKVGRGGYVDFSRVLIGKSGTAAKWGGWFLLGLGFTLQLLAEIGVL